jgi:hypothetical protein
VASRWYFSAAGTIAGVEPAYDAGWNYATEASRRALLAAKSASESLTIGTQIGPWSNTAGQTALDRQYISEPLKAQTISGTFKGQVMTREYATTDNVDRLFVAVKVVSNDGTTVRATLFARANATTTVEFINNVSHRNKRIADGDALSSYDCIDGDRLLIEIGYSNSTAGTTPEASARWGAPTGTNDLPENETQTTAGVGWIEFSADVGRLFTFTPTDGVVLSGAATTSYEVGTTVYTFAPSGGVTLAGAATVERVNVWSVTPSGGVTLAGAAGIAATYAPLVSGGVTLAGTAPLATTRAYPVSGGVELAGTGTIAVAYAPPVAGGITLAGAAATEYAVAGVTEYPYQPSGGVTLGGAAAVATAVVVLPSGGIELSGAAETLTVAVYTAAVSGGVTLGGTAAIAVSRALQTAGGVVLSGTAGLSVGLVPSVSGGVTLAGAASTIYIEAGTATDYVYLPSGGLTAVGSATTEYRPFRRAASGGGGGGGRTAHPAGLWRRPVEYVHRVSGSVALSGAATTYQPLNVQVIGGSVVSLGGAADVRFPIRSYRSVVRFGVRPQGRSSYFSPVNDEREALALLSFFD